MIQFLVVVTGKGLGWGQTGGLHPRRRVATGKQPENFARHWFLLLLGICLLALAISILTFGRLGNHEIRGLALM